MTAKYSRLVSQIAGSLVIGSGMVLLVACAHKPPTGALPDIPVNIIFDAENCPEGVNPAKAIDVSKAAGQRIVWQAVDGGGEPVDKRYQIYFDPFKGRPLKSNSHGYLRSPKVESGTPVNVEYKYSIEGQECKRDALDPRFRLF